MKAILVKDDAAHSFYPAEVPTPKPAPDAVLIKIYATAVNRADLLQRRGLYPPPPGESDLFGLEAAGVIVEKGDHVQNWQLGDRVCCLLGSGGYADYVAVHQDLLLPIPAHLSFEQAAAIPEVFYTAFVNLFLEGELQAGESLLIHAGGSGVGTAAIQLAKQAGAKIFITAGSEEKIQRCLSLGADFGINYKTEDFAERIFQLTGQKGVNIILDGVGGKYLSPNLSLLQWQGRLVLIGLLGGAKAEIDLALVLRKRLRVIGSVLRSRSLAEKVAITAAFKEKVLPLFLNRQIHPVIDSVFSLAEVDKAHAHVAANKNFGKVVLRVRGP
ncbi:MAG: NAD(P)H-quinone oxidoreductase [candidate division KSB1 bacterium]|nr:NAD(P)H-quinone oxidoreductase [candidate division KSB1 bacterium]MDZ7365983.1 NAD(P)H-quinone oxidoreductase [candidate division KSB1 bacterium]MDZ7404100.1 NAD(P)H-quinone oxidoreductase [candidate division KSB1 bacterium]